MEETTVAWFRFIVICFAIVFVVVKTKGPSKIFDRLRAKYEDKFLGDLLSCVYCLSCWVCPIVAAIIFHPNTLRDAVEVILLDGLFAIGITVMLFWFINSIESFLESFSIFSESIRSMSSWFVNLVMFYQKTNKKVD